MAFYTGVDQERYDAGNKFLPMNQFLLNYTAPTTNVEEEENVITSYGIPNTNAFVNTNNAPREVPLSLTYDPRAVAATQATSVNNLLQAKGDPIHIKGYEHPASGTEMHGYPTRTFSSVSEGTPAISEAQFPPGIMEIANYDEVFGPKTVVDSVTGKTHTLPAPERFSFPEDEDKESWYSSLFSRTPRVRGTLGTRLANAPRIPFPAALASWSLSPFNKKSRNYNPDFEDQLNYLEMQNNMIGIDPNTGLHKYGPDSVLSGKNVISLFGSNDYEEALEKQKAWFENRINRGKKISWTNYQKLIKEEKKLEDKQKDIDDKDKAVAKTIRPQHHGDVSGGGVGGKGGQGDYTTPSLHQAPKEHTAPSKTGHMGPGGIHYAQGGRVYLNLGGLASIL